MPLDTDKHRKESITYKVNLQLTNIKYHKVWQEQNEPCPHTTLHNIRDPNSSNISLVLCTRSSSERPATFLHN